MEKRSSQSGDNEISSSIFVNAAHEGKTPHLFNVRLEDFIHHPPPLGLKLSHYAVKEIRDTWNAKQRPKENASIPNVIFHATCLKIGEFNFVPTCKGHLVAKFYFVEKQFLWEVFDTRKSVKQNVEVEWRNILAIRAVIQDNMPGILEIELEKEPEFHREYYPPRRTHEIREKSQDFTGGHALTYRRHYLEFPPGVLDGPYEDLLQSDTRLRELAKLPFPSLGSPYFDNSTPPISMACGVNGFNDPIPQNQKPRPGYFDDIIKLLTKVVDSESHVGKWEPLCCGTNEGNLSDSSWKGDRVSERNTVTGSNSMESEGQYSTTNANMNDNQRLLSDAESSTGATNHVFHNK